MEEKARNRAVNLYMHIVPHQYLGLLKKWHVLYWSNLPELNMLDIQVVEMAAFDWLDAIIGWNCSWCSFSLVPVKVHRKLRSQGSVLGCI